MNYHFSGLVSAADVKRHLPHIFQAPESCSRIVVCLHYAPPGAGEIQNMVTLTIFDPAGFRGAGHRHGDTHVVELLPEHATPGYLPGPLLAGEWTVQIDTHMILPDEPCRYELTIETEQASETGAADAAASTLAFEFVARTAPGWYRGDIHTHTNHSDAEQTVTELVERARQARLDFIALTDHNTISPLREMASLSSPSLLTLGGQELTTFWGHAICLGAHDWIDWRVDANGEQMAAIAEQVYAQGALFIIAHPLSLGDPYCTGCRWVYQAMMPGNARLVEIWNGPWWGEPETARFYNEEGVQLWYRWLNEGQRIYATAGSDTHSVADYNARPGFCVVYAQELSECGVIQALAQGRAYLSSGPALNLQASTAAGVSAAIGETLTLKAQEEFSVQAVWSAAPEQARLALVVNGEAGARLTVSREGEQTWRLPAKGVRWCVIELRAADNSMLAITNPIFMDIA